MSFLQLLPRLNSSAFARSVPLQCLRNSYLGINLLENQQGIQNTSQQLRWYAKRRGARLARQKESRKRASARRLLESKTVKEGWKPRRLIIDKSALVAGSRRFDDSDKMDHPMDDVYFVSKDLKRFRYSFEECLEMHRETHHPSMMNSPQSLLDCRLELCLKTKKKTRFVPAFSGIVHLPNNFEYPRNRRIVAICKKEEEAELARKAGAVIAGGLDVIKMLKDGLLTTEDYEEIVVHGDMLVPVTTVRGILGKNFPTKEKGNYGLDIELLVRRFLEGFDYESVRDDYDLDLGWVDVPIGRLDMSAEHLKENLIAVCVEVEKYRPKDRPPGPFITRMLLNSPPSREQFIVRHWEFLEGYENPNPIYSENTNEEVVIVQN